MNHDVFHHHDSSSKSEEVRTIIIFIFFTLDVIELRWFIERFQLFSETSIWKKRLNGRIQKHIVFFCGKIKKNE